MAPLASAPSRTYDPLQSVLSHLPHGMYGGYEALCNFMFIDSTVPMHVKEGLRFLSAVKIGCRYCSTVREKDSSGDRLLSDAFYDQVASGDPNCKEIADPWAAVLRMGAEVLDEGEVSPKTMAELRAHLTEPQIVEALFFMLLIGASHRFSRA